MNLDLDIGVLLGLVRGPFQGLDLDPALVQKDLEVHLRAVYLDQNQDRDQDLNHITEVTQEIVIVEDIILHRNQYLNLDPELNLNLDLDQDQEVNPDANDLVVSKIKCQHCQGRMYIVINMKLSVCLLLFNYDIRYYGRRGKSSSLELELSDNEEKVSPAASKLTVTNITNM